MKVRIDERWVKGEDCRGFFLLKKEFEIVNRGNLSKRARASSDHKPDFINVLENQSVEENLCFLREIDGGKNVKGGRLYILDIIKNNGIPVREIDLLYRLGWKSFAK